jgi:hypothetical protein
MTNVTQAENLHEFILNNSNSSLSTVSANSSFVPATMTTATSANTTITNNYNTTLFNNNNSSLTTQNNSLILVSQAVNTTTISSTTPQFVSTAFIVMTTKQTSLLATTISLSILRANSTFDSINSTAATVQTTQIFFIDYIFSLNMTLNQAFDSDYNIASSMKYLNLITNITKYVTIFNNFLISRI